MACLVIAFPASAAVTTLGAPASAATTNTLAYTVPAGTDRLLVVTASNASATAAPTAVTFGGTPMTLVVQRDDGFAIDTMWRLTLGSSASPSSGTITVTGFATAVNTVITAQGFAGVNQTTPIDGTGTQQANTGSNIGSSITLNTTTAGDLTYDIFDSFVNVGSITTTPGASQSGVHDVNLSVVSPSGGFGRYRTSTKAATGASTTMSWTSNTIAILHLAANINAAPAGAAPAVTSPTSIAVTTTTATLGGNVTADGGAAISARGVVLSPTATNNNPLIGGSGVVNLTTTGTTGVFTLNASGLTPNTAYSFKAYATNGVGTGYSSIGTFTTTGPPAVLVSPTTVSLSESSSASASFRVSLSIAPSSNVMVALTFPGAQVQVDTGSGFGTSPQTVTLTPANAVAGVNVAVRAVDDGIVEADPHTVSIVTANASSSEAAFNGLAVEDVVVAIADNDTAGITLVESGGSTDVAEGGATDTYTLVLNSEPSAVTTTYSFTGSTQTFVVPAGVTTLQVEAWGAQGNSNANGIAGGFGGYARGVLSVTPGSTLFIEVGGGGSVSSLGGYNGGGAAGGSGCAQAIAGGGGGASDVRVGGTGLANRVIVAAGGGGAAGNRVAGCGRGTGGGGGGGYYGGGGGAAWPSASLELPQGGDQTAGGLGGTSTYAPVAPANNGLAGVFGIGGAGGQEVVSNQAGSQAASSGGAGGGSVGANGSYAGNFTGQSGAGGSSFLGTLDVASTTPGVRTGNGQVVLTYQSVSIALNAGPQLTVAPSPLVFTSGNWNLPQTVTVTAVDDAAVEGNHTGTITHAVTSTDAAYNNFTVPNVTASITDNDMSTLSINDVSVTEGNTGTATLSFTVTRTGATTSAAGFSFATANGTATAGSDYVAVSGTGSIPAGGATGTTQVSVTINGDAVFENNETLFVNLTAPTNATIGDGQGIGTISNDDTAPTLSINDVSIVEGNTGTSNLVFTVTRTGLTELPATFTATTADGTASAPSDYLAALTGSTSIAAGGATGTTTLSATINGDAVVEPNETFFVNLTAPGNATVADNQGIGTITNDDGAGVVINESSGTANDNNITVTEGGAGASFAVVLTSQPTSEVQVSMTFNGTIIQAGSPTPGGPPAILSFTSANWNVPQVVSVGAVNDGVAANFGSTNLSLAVGSADPNYVGIPTQPASPIVVRVIEDDVPGVTVSESGGSTAATEGGATDTYTLVLTSQPSSNVTVTLSPSAQLTSVPTPLVFSPTNWNVAQAVTVSAVDDGIVEGPHSGAVAHAVTSADANFNGLTVAPVAVSITDNDSAVVSFAPANVSQSEATSPMAFTVTLSNPVASGVSLRVNSAPNMASSPADFTAIINQPVVFPANSTASQTLNITIANDALDEDNETFSLTLSGINATGDVTLGTATATGTIEDDDALPVLSVANVTQPEGNASNTLTFTVNLSPVSGRAVSFTRATADGTAVSTAPTPDYAAIAASSVTIPAGQTSVTIPVTINGDATFEGDESFTLSLTGVANATPGTLSATGTLTEDDQQPTTTTIVSDLPDPSVVGQGYPVTVEVRAQTLPPLGTVSISDGTGASCNAPLTTGTAPLSTMSCTLTSTSAGAKTLTATYTPANDAFAASNDTEGHQVNAAATSLVLLGPARARIGTAASYSAELSVTAPGAGTPAGIVTVSSGPNSCTITLPTATPSCTITFASLGSRAVSATFAPGNGNFTGSTATPVQTLVFSSSDLSVTKTNAVNTYRPGDLLVYTVVVRNNGPDAAPQVRIRDVAPAGLTNVAWTCEASGGAICPDSGGTGTLDHIVATLPTGGTLTYAYFGNVTGRPAQIVNTAEVILPADTTIEDPNPANNSATDTDLLDDLFTDGFEVPGINAESGGVRLAGANLRNTQDEVARVTVRLSDIRGEALRVYVRVVGGELQVALALRGADGNLRLGSWQRPVGDAELTWTATPTAGGFVLSGAELR